VANELDNIAKNGKEPMLNQGVKSMVNPDGSVSQIVPATGGGETVPSSSSPQEFNNIQSSVLNTQSASTEAFGNLQSTPLNVSGSTTGTFNPVSTLLGNFVSSFTNSNLASVPSYSPQNTIASAQNDPGMAKAIDTHNTQENTTAIQGFNNKPRGSVGTMQTRAGALQFMQNSKTGNLDLHLPDQPFASNTNVPFNQFQSVIDSPQMQYEMAQMFAGSSLTPDSANGVLKAQDMDTFKMEMNNNHNQALMQSYRTNSSVTRTVGQTEEIFDMLENEVADRFSDIEETMGTTNDKLDSLL
jgi:hypothetical protein